MTGYIHSFLMTLSSFGYLGIALALMVEVIPSEIVLAYGGYLISNGQLSFLGVLVAGTIGGTVAQWLIYWIGLYGGRLFWIGMESICSFTVVRWTQRSGGLIVTAPL